MAEIPEPFSQDASELLNKLVIFFLTIVVLYLGSQLVHRLLKNIKYSKMISKLKEQRSQEIQAFLAKYYNVVPYNTQQHILSLTASQLLDELKNEVITSEQIVITYSIRAATIGLEYGLIADINFEDAIVEAREKDKQRKDPKVELPPLHGLPLSVKDHVTTRGLRYTGGFAHAVNLPKSESDCNFVKVLRDKGAFFYVASNIPQGIGAIESSNKIWGRAKNPWDKDRTPGGSSGGEAGLIAAKCSPLGIGSDAAGSIRIPSSFCGVYGYSPTSKRISLKRTLNLRKYDLHVFREINCTYGPIGRCVDDLVLIMKNLFGNFTTSDPDIPPLPWNEDKYMESFNRKLRIGYMLDDIFCESCPGNRNVVKEVVNVLKSQGHELVEVKENWTEKFLITGLPIMQAHGMASNLEKTLQGEIPESFYFLQVLLSKFPSFMVRLFGHIANFIGEKRMGKILKVMKKRNLNEFFQEVYKKELLKDDFADKWHEYRLDAMISPVLPFPAIRHGDAEMIQGLIGNTFIYNIMGMPSGVVPIRGVKVGEEYYESRYNDLAARKIKKVVKNTKGLPLTVQVATFNFDDELCLCLMKQIEKHFDYHLLPEVEIEAPTVDDLSFE